MSRLRTILVFATLTAALAVVAASPAQAAKPPFYGVVTQTPLSEHEDDLMKQAGVGTLRVQLGWPIVQAPEGRCQASAQVGVCDWAAYDSLIGGLAERGIEIFPYLLNVPGFIAKNPNTPPMRSRRRARAGRTSSRLPPSATAPAVPTGRPSTPSSTRSPTRCRSATGRSGTSRARSRSGTRSRRPASTRSSSS